MHQTFHRSTLPTNAIAFSSPDGRGLFSEALAARSAAKRSYPHTAAFGQHEIEFNTQAEIAEADSMGHVE